MTDSPETLSARLRASGTKSAPRNGDGVYMSICDEAADRIDALEAALREVAEALRDKSIVRNPAFESDDVAWLRKWLAAVLQQKGKTQ